MPLPHITRPQRHSATARPAAPFGSRTPRSAIWQPHTPAAPFGSRTPQQHHEQRAVARMRRRGGVRGHGPGNGPPDLPRDERLTPRRPAAATVVVTVLSRCVDGGNGGGGDSYAAPSSANRAEAACEPMPAIVASAHRCPQGSRRARVQLHACHPSVTRDHDLRARRSA